MTNILPKSGMTASAAGKRLGRRGMAAVLAMLYLVLFSALSIGFYAAFTLGTQTSYSERESRRALAAAESGMEFIRHRLWALNIEHDTAAEVLFDEVYDQLAASLNGTANLNGGNISLDGETILIPGDPTQYIDLNGSGESFRITIERFGKELIVSAIGKTSGGASSADLGRGVRFRYGIFERPSSIFDFGVASKSTINMVGNTDIFGSPDPASGSVLSTANVDFPLIMGDSMGDSCSISGEVSFSNPKAWVQATPNTMINGEVGEANWSDNIHHVGEPDFPEVDTADYAAFATTTITGSKPEGTTFTNIRIPAGLNPTFNADVELKGVIYIEEPNQVKFNGHATITGVIVVENNDGTNWDSNKIEFRGGATATGTENLPADDPAFTALREMQGAFLLAPGFSVDFGGNVNTHVTGAIVGSSISFGGTADAVVDGSVINLEPSSSVDFHGTAGVTIKSNGTKKQPHGLYFGSRYVPLAGSYEEINSW